RPVITADLANMEGVMPESITMKISGLGEVKPVYNAETKSLSYTPHQRLRLPEYWVQVTLKRSGEKKEDVLRWKFLVDAVANYIPADWEPKAEKETSDPEPRSEESQAAVSSSID